MRRLESPAVRAYTNLTIYLDDLKSINDLIVEHGAQPTFTTNMYEFDNWQEFSTNVKSFKYLKIHAPNTNGAFVDLQFKKRYCKLDCSYGDRSVNDSLFLKIDNILLNSKRPLAWLFDYKASILNLLLLVIIGLAIRLVDKSYKPLFFVCQYFLVAFAIFTLFNPSYRIIYKAKNRDSTEGFYERNKDQLITAILAGLVIALITYIATIVAATVVNH